MKLIIKLIEKENGSYYIGFIEGTGIMTSADTLPKIQQNIIDAINAMKECDNKTK